MLCTEADAPGDADSSVGVFLPLLIGLFLLYPWLAGSRKIDYSQENLEQAEEETDKTT